MRQRLFTILSCLLVSVAMMAQHKVTGVVLDNEGEPAVGASIVEKGNARNGVIADIEGNFALTVSKSSATLVVSYVALSRRKFRWEAETK